jgi:quinol monooxygenase YgiN
MAEPGVKLFLPYRSPTNSSLFFVFELYVDEAAWSAHEATDHFRAAIKELLPRVARRERVPFIPFVV